MFHVQLAYTFFTINDNIKNERQFDFQSIEYVWAKSNLEIEKFSSS